MWTGFQTWNNRDLVVARTAASIPFIESALREIQREAVSFQMSMLREVGVRQPQVGRVEDVYPRSRVDLLEVYSRPARDAAQVLAGGGSEEAAFKAFEKRLNGIVEADVAIAERDEIERFQDLLESEGILETDEDSEPLHDDDDPTDLMTREEMEEYLGVEDPDEEPVSEAPPAVDNSKKIIGFRRVVRPELSQYGPCGLCVVAATRWYTRKNLKAIHHLCKCVTLPVTKDSDPGFRMNEKDLRRNLDLIYGVAGGNTKDKLKRVRVVVREHGELGAVLTRKADAPNGWAEKARLPAKTMYVRPTREHQMARLRERRAELVSTLERLQDKKAIFDVEQHLRHIDMQLAA